MKKIYSVFIVLSLFSFNCFSQVKGISKDIIAHNNTEFDKGAKHYEKWIFFDYGGGNIQAYWMFFEQTPIGLMHAVKEAKKLCDLNGKNFNNPDKDNSLIPSYAEDIFDYSNMNTGIKLGDGEINKIWNFKTSHTTNNISFGSDKGDYFISTVTFRY